MSGRHAGCGIAAVENIEFDNYNPSEERFYLHVAIDCRLYM